MRIARLNCWAGYATGNVNSSLLVRLTSCLVLWQLLFLNLFQHFEHFLRQFCPLTRKLNLRGKNTRDLHITQLAQFLIKSSWHLANRRFENFSKTTNPSQCLPSLSISKQFTTRYTTGYFA